MSEVLFHFYAPTHGDSKYIGQSRPEIKGTPEHIVKIAKAAEKGGFDGILIPTGPNCADAFITATNIVINTENLRPLIAIRPGFISPTVASKMVSTLDVLSNGRVSLNVVSGGSPKELAMDGDFTNHDKRYERTKEFTEILRGVWEDDPFNYTGRFYKIDNAKFTPAPLQKPYPKLYLGGTSDPAVTVASELFDTYLMWGEPVEDVKAQIQKVKEMANIYNRHVKFGIRINIITASSEKVAWEKAEKIISQVNKDKVSMLKEYMDNSDSISLKRIQSLRGREFEDPCFWTGMTSYRSGNSTALVGSYKQVAESLIKYINVGITEFIFSSYPHLETVSEIGKEILPRIKKEVNYSKDGNVYI
ncbi:LLM class flavin-dependent oxidoreductase [Priestia megaterium]|uniref:LLM class flavin-dependent oxidoreductase n=1 Tax=Priestia megaterium TaxID=1404 RepID=UPI00207AF671|nr:LLM class flavin-dependent oxidoreductase [Priestia megaterium]USL45558.1 LLM class flavin-dependent oxidoreductase [Priestia megaterium]